MLVYNVDNLARVATLAGLYTHKWSAPQDVWKVHEDTRTKILKSMLVTVRQHTAKLSLFFQAITVGRT